MTSFRCWTWSAIVLLGSHLAAAPRLRYVIRPTPDFAQILSEARKYRLNLIVANQFIGQMEEEIKNAIFGNVGTVASFRVGVTDAIYLAHEFQPIFNEQDLINVDKFNC